MNAMTLYKLLNEHGVEFDVVEIFEGVRILRVSVEDLIEDDLTEEENQNG
jgi:hypothetical protein